MCQLLSWALARSPGDRSLAWARLASFWDPGFLGQRADSGAGHAREKMEAALKKGGLAPVANGWTLTSTCSTTTSTTWASA
jgi:hypothetical protein